MDKKFKGLLITSRDLDGGVIATLASIAFNIDIDIVYSENGKEAEYTIERELFVENIENAGYTHIFIGKVSFDTNSSMPGVLDALAKKMGWNLTYYNHQSCNEYLNDMFDWAKVIPSLEGKQLMSADIFYKDLLENYGLRKSEWLDDLVEMSRKYHTYEWKKDNDVEPRRLNEMFFSKLTKDAVNNLVQKYYMKSAFISVSEMEDILKKEKDYDEFLDAKKFETKITTLNINDKTFKVAFVTSDKYISELGYDIATSFKNVDAAGIINSSYSKIRFRRGNNENIDVSEIAKAFGGNGSAYAAGAKITPAIQKKLNEVFINTLLGEYNISKKK